MSRINGVYKITRKRKYFITFNLEDNLIGHYQQNM